MKKITYLVAPLMVMPFLLGCNKVTTHKVAHVGAMHLNFTQMNGKDLANSSFNEGQDFKFKVKATQEGTLEDAYSIDPNGIGIYVGKDALLPLLDGYTVTYTKADKTEAEVTILGSKVKDDIYIEGIARQKGHYIWCVPLMYGVRMPEGKPTLGWGKVGSNEVLEFEAVDEDHGLPAANSFLYSDDLENFHYYDAGNLDSWMTDHIEYAQQPGGTRAQVTIKGNSMVEGDYMLIAARSANDTSFLDAFSWDDIKEASDTGIAQYLFNVGDEKDVSFKTTGDEEVKHRVRIIGFNHDVVAGGESKAGITFQFSTAISDVSGKAIDTKWNTERKSTDFETAHLNEVLQNETFQLLPEDLRNSIKTVTKSVGKFQNNKWSAVSYDTKLFPLADIEVSENPRTSSGSSIYYVEGEGETYEYYEGNDVHEKRQVTGVDGTAVNYWLRSPYNYYSNTGIANYVGNKGYLNGDGGYVDAHTFAIVPAFCI